MSAEIDYRPQPLMTAGAQAGGDNRVSIVSILTTSGRPVLAATVRVAEQRWRRRRLTAEVSDDGHHRQGGTASKCAAIRRICGGRRDGTPDRKRLPIARVSRGLGALPFYLRGLSGSWFIDSVGAASRVDQLGAPQLLSTGAELSTDLELFSFLPLRVRTGVGVPLKSLGPVSRGEARFYVTAGTSF